MIDASGRDIRLQVDGGVTAANIKVRHKDIVAIYIFIYNYIYTLSYIDTYIHCHMYCMYIYVCIYLHTYRKLRRPVRTCSLLALPSLRTHAHRTLIELPSTL
jgi:hypothetical protein